MDIVVRAVIIYAVVFAFTRILGRRELSTCKPFDPVLLVPGTRAAGLPGEPRRLSDVSAR